MSDRSAPSRRITWGAATVVAAVTLLAFLPALQNGFVTWDDDTNFLNNPYYRGLGGDQLHWMWTTFHMGHYVPLSWMTLGLDYVLWGMNPAGYHLTNLLLHAANAVAVYFIARRMLRLAGAVRGDDAMAVAIPAAFAALAFAIHPLRVESVVWITERRDVLSGLLASLTVLAYLRSLEPGRPRTWYWVAVATFAAALLSKATVVTVPVVLAILNVYPLKRLSGSVGWWTPPARRVYREMAPFVLLSTAASAMTFVALQHVDQLTAGQKVAVSAYSLAFYALKTVVPTQLSPLYKMPQGVDAAAPMFLVSYVAVVALTVAAWFAGRRHRAAWIVWIVFVAITFPMLGFHQNGPQIAADRYTYHAAPALALLAAALLFTVRRPLSSLPIGAAAAILVTLGALTWRQTEVWHDSERMWTHVLDIDPGSSVAHTALGNVLLRRGDVPDAIEHYRQSLAIDPRAPEAHDNLGVALSSQGKLAEAMREYQQTLMLKPDDYEAENDMGVTIARAGNVGDAIEHYRRALAIKPDYADAHVNWGNALIRQGNAAEAIEHYQRAIALRPDDADAERNWGVALARQGRLADAITHFRRAILLAPGDADARQYLDQATAQLARER